MLRERKEKSSLSALCRAEQCIQKSVLINIFVWQGLVLYELLIAMLMGFVAGLQQGEGSLWFVCQCHCAWLLGW